MHKVVIDGRSRAVPAEWNELTPKLLLGVIGVLYGRNESLQQLRLRLLAVVLQVPLATVLFLFTPVQIIEVQWLTDFLLDEVRLTAQLLPMVRLPWRRDWHRRRWFGPREKLKNVTFREFIFADSYFVAFVKKPAQTEWLDKLVAVLYRPQRRPYRPQAIDYAGDRREDFNPEHIEARAAVLTHLPLATKQAIFTWYHGCRGQLERNYPLVFTASEDAGAGSRDGWAHVLREMSGGAFGTLEQTQRERTSQVLAKMEDDARRAEALAEQARKQNP